MRVLVAIFCCAVATTHLHAQDAPVADSTQPTLSPDQLSTLIDDLSSPTYSVRQRATEQLSLLGSPAIEELEKALAQSTDLESKARLASVVSEIRGFRLKKALEAFRRDIDPSNSHGLEAWPRMSQIVGDSRVAKLLMIEMYEAQPKLMRAIADTDEVLQQVAVEAAKSIPERGRYSDTGDGWALVLACVVAKKPIDLEVQYRAIQSIREYPTNQKFTDPRWKNDVRKLVGAWLEKMPFELAREGLALAGNYDIPNGSVIARQVLTNQAIDPSLFYASIRVLARHGSVDDIALLEPWLANETVMVETAKRVQSPLGIPTDEDHFPPDAELQRIQVLYQDAALAAAVILTKQTLKDYFPESDEAGNGDFVLQQIGAPVDKPEQRALAFERWKKFRESQPAGPAKKPQ
jgi:hypothetical protein